MFDWFWEFLYGLVKVPLFCIDFVVGVAEMLCGIDPVTVDGQDVEITQYFLTSASIMEAFIWVCIIGFVLLFVFTAFTVFRSIAKNGEGKTPVQICVDASKILLYFIMVPTIMVLAAVGVSTVMTSIYEVTSPGNQGLASSMFVIFAEDAYDGDGSEKEAILRAFITGEKDYYSTGTVSKYFDLSEFNYFLGFAAGISVLVLLVISLLSFVERLISLVVLFILAPISMSTAPLDEGARFKLWRDQVINKFLMAYGSLIALNVFMLVVSVVNTVQFYDNSYLNGLARLLFILGGAFACRKSTILIGNLINHGAGSQDAADNAHMNAGMKRLVATAAAPALGLASKAGALVGRTVTKPARMAGRSIRNNVSSALHRSSRARREAKEHYARRSYEDKLLAKEQQKLAGQSTENAVFAQKSSADSKEKISASVERAQGTQNGGAASAPNGADSGANQAAASKLSDAMSRTSKDDGDSSQSFGGEGGSGK